MPDPIFILAISQPTAGGWDLRTVLMLAFGILIVGFFMMRMNRQRLRPRPQDGPPATAQDRVRAAQQADNLRDQLDSLMVQLEELARTTTAQIETRYSKLDVLLRQADEKIARLESLLANVDGRPLPRPANGSPAESRPEHRRIYELADAGRLPVEIAKETGRDVGEVELILALRKKS